MTGTWGCAPHPALARPHRTEGGEGPRRLEPSGDRLDRSLRSLVFVAVALLIQAGTATAQEGDHVGDVQLSPGRLTEYDYTLEITESAVNKLFARLAELDARRPDLDRKMKALKVSVSGKQVNLAGAVQVPVLGSVKFDMAGDLKLEAPDTFAFHFNHYKLSKESPVADVPLALGKSVLLAIFSVFTRNKHVTEYLEISTNLMANIPFTPASWKKVYFKLKPKALPVINNMVTLYLGKEGDHFVLQGRLR